MLLTTETVRTYRGALQQSRTREETVNEAVALSDWNLYLEPRAAGQVHAEDHVAVDGLSLEVDGEPWSVRNHRTGRVDHVECRLKRSA